MILNLTDVENSDIKYTFSRFPDGELQIALGEFSRKERIAVRCRITNTEDLFILMQVADILNRHGVIWDLEIYYLMGMRMDRVMDFNRPFTLKVVVNIIKNLGAKHIGIFTPHSKICLNLFGELYVYDIVPPELNQDNKYQIVLPDEGAIRRYGVRNDWIIGEKVRDIKTGKILSLKIKNPEKIDGRPLLIIDDLCDGGGTFIGLAEAIREINPNLEINIQVDHMVNPKGLKNLAETFNHVWITNSYKDWSEEIIKLSKNNVTQIKVV